MEQETAKKMRAVKRTTPLGTFLALPVGGYCELSILDVSKESARTACSRLKREGRGTWKVNTIDGLKYSVERLS